MGRKCSVCSHIEIKKINRMLIEGKPLSEIISIFPEITKSSLYRHKKEHLPETLIKSKEIQEILTADNLLDELQKVRERTNRLLAQAEKAGEIRTWPAFLRELREQIKLLAELEGRISSQPQVNINALFQIIESEVRNTEVLERIRKRLNEM